MSCTFSRFVLTLLGLLIALGCAFERIHLASDGCCDIVCLQKIVRNIGCMHQKATNTTSRFFKHQRLTACHRRPPKETWPIFLISHFLALKTRYSYFRTGPGAIIRNSAVITIPTGKKPSNKGNWQKRSTAWFRMRTCTMNWWPRGSRPHCITAWRHLSFPHSPTSLAILPPCGVIGYDNLNVVDALTPRIAPHLCSSSVGAGIKEGRNMCL